MDCFKSETNMVSMVDSQQCLEICHKTKENMCYVCIHFCVTFHMSRFTPPQRGPFIDMIEMKDPSYRE